MHWRVAIFAWLAFAEFSGGVRGEPVLLCLGPNSRFVAEIIEESTSEDRIRFQLESGVVMTVPRSSVTRRYTGDFLNDFVRAERSVREQDWSGAIEGYRQAAAKSPDVHFANELREKARQQFLAALPHLDRLESCADIEHFVSLVDPRDAETVLQVRGAVKAWYRTRFNEWKVAADQAEMRDDYRSAILKYSTALGCATDYPGLHSELLKGLARVHIKEAYRLYHWGGAHEAVLDHVEAAIEASPAYQQAHLLKAEVYCVRGEELLDRREEIIQSGDAALAASLLAEASAAQSRAAEALRNLDALGGVPLGTRNRLHRRTLDLRRRLMARQRDLRQGWRSLAEIPPRSLTGRVQFYAKKGWRSVAGLLFRSEFWFQVYDWARTRWVTLFVGFPLPFLVAIFLDRDARKRGVLEPQDLTLFRLVNAAYCVILLAVAWWLRTAEALIPFSVACFVPATAYFVYVRFVYRPTGVCLSCGSHVSDYEDYQDLDFSRCPNCHAPLQTPLTLLGYIRQVAESIERGTVGVDGARRIDTGAPLHQRDRMLLLIRLLITHALRRRASDIHIELDRAVEGKRVLGLRCRVRLRVDGVLFYEVDFSALLHTQLVSAIKGMANMDIADRLHPQDGHFHQTADGADIHVRVSTSPTSTGEKMVLRLLDKRQVMRHPAELGFQPLALIEFEDAIHSPQGIILATGPSGSGKTTLLYSSLCTLLDGEKSVVSVEDPIEYDISGINQIQHDVKAGVTFSNALRNILRQDPDIIMVGEMRDAETTQLVVEAAKTGHLVFSTLHTTDACSAPFRFMDLGASTQDLAATLRVVVAQRLVRVICPHCKTEADVDPRFQKTFLEQAEYADIKVWKGKGCAACRGTGYLGRTGLFEVLVVSETIRELIAERQPVSKVRNAAQTAGMRTLWEDGMFKVSEGITTLDEVFRVARPVRRASPSQ